MQIKLQLPRDVRGNKKHSTNKLEEAHQGKPC